MMRFGHGLCKNDQPAVGDRLFMAEMFALHQEIGKRMYISNQMAQLCVCVYGSLPTAAFSVSKLIIVLLPSFIGILPCGLCEKLFDSMCPKPSR